MRLAGRPDRLREQLPQGRRPLSCLGGDPRRGSDPGPEEDPRRVGAGRGKFRRGGDAERVDRPDRNAPSSGRVAGDGDPRRSGRPVFPAGRRGARRGIGERLTPLPWNVPFHAVIVRPAFGLSTREGYARLGREPGAPPPRAPVPTFRTFSEVAAVVRNDFEAAWGPSRPEIGGIRRELANAGAAAAGLSGSGSAVFGLFTSEGAAREAREKLSAGGDGGKGRRIFVARSV